MPFSVHFIVSELDVPGEDRLYVFDNYIYSFTSLSSDIIHNIMGNVFKRRSSNT